MQSNENAITQLLSSDSHILVIQFSEGIPRKRAVVFCNVLWSIVPSILSPELVICEDEILNIDILRNPVLNLSILSNITMFIYTLDVTAPLV